MSTQEMFVWISGIIAVCILVVSVANSIRETLQRKYECQRPLYEKDDDNGYCFSYGWISGDSLDEQVDYLASVFQKRVIILFNRINGDSWLRDEMEACYFEFTSWGFRDLLQEIDEKVERIKNLELNGDGDSEDLRNGSLTLLEWFKNEVELFVACDMVDKEQDDY